MNNLRNSQNRKEASPSVPAHHDEEEDDEEYDDRLDARAESKENAMVEAIVRNSEDTSSPSTVTAASNINPIADKL